MRKILVGLSIAIMSCVIFSEMVMKVELNGEVDNVKLSTLSKIVFDGNTMVAGSSYDLDVVDKITFYDDGTAIIHNDKSSVAQDKIGFQLNASNLALTVPKASDMTVKIFSVQGRQIAELHKGRVKAGVLDLSIQHLNLATGIYSIVVQSNNQLFVRKIVHQ